MDLSPSLIAAVNASRARVRYAFPWWLRPFLMRGVAGITLGRRVYIAAGVGPDQMERFLRHELEHVHQVVRYGLIRFYWRYISEYIRNRRRGLPPDEAYRTISFETEALAAEKTYNSPTATG